MTENNKEMLQETVVIYSGGIANDLMKQGFRMLPTTANKKKKGWSVFHFEPSRELLDYLQANHPNVARTIVDKQYRGV